MSDDRNARVTGDVRVHVSPEPDVLLITSATTLGPMGFEIGLDLVPLLIGKIMTGAKAIEMKKGQTLAEVVHGVDAATVQAVKVRVGNAIGAGGRGLIGMPLTRSGIPSTAGMTPREARELALALVHAADDQAKHTAQKPS